MARFHDGQLPAEEVAWFGKIGLTSEQGNYKPAAGVWSIAKCAGHIALGEDLIREMVEDKVLTAAPSGEGVAERKSLDDHCPLQPSRQFATPEAAPAEIS